MPGSASVCGGPLLPLINNLQEEELVKRTVLVIACLAVLAIVLPALPIVAQAPPPPNAQPAPSEGMAKKKANGQWYVPAEAIASTEYNALFSPTTVHTPDSFGYSWDDAATYSWIEAAPTNPLDFGGAGATLVSLPFSFTFYENTYSKVCVAEDGYLSFTSSDICGTTWPSQGEIPSPTPPNNVIAPYWSPLVLSGTGLANRVYTKIETTPTNRFVIEWYQVKTGHTGDIHDETLTFEVILDQSGYITVQYNQMNFGSDNAPDFCATAGIENDDGLVGLTSLEFCGTPASSTAVRFIPPGPGARIGFIQPHQGRFTQPGATETFTVTLENWGDLPDTFSLNWDKSTTGWVDTSTLPTTTVLLNPGAQFTADVNITAPWTTAVGDNVKLTVTATSNRTPTVTKQATVQVAIPAPLAQSYREDRVDLLSPMDLYLAKPSGEIGIAEHSASYSGINRWLSVDQTPNGNLIHVWTTPDDYFTYYAMYTKDGVPLWRQPRQLYTDYTCGTGCILHDNGTTVAVAPNGKIGIAWYRTENNANGRRYNVHFAMLDPAGNLVGSILNLTGNTFWRTSSGLNQPRARHVHVAATDDSRFVIVWQWSDRTVDPDSTDVGNDRDDQQEIYYAVVSSAGSIVRQKTRLSPEDTAPNTTGYSWPTVAPLSGNKAAVYWTNYGQQRIEYSIVGPDNAATSPAVLNNTSGIEPWYLDSQRLSDGRVFVAWAAWGGCGDGSHIRYVVADDKGTATSSISPTCLQSAQVAESGDAFLSLAADAQGRAIFSWMDTDPKQQRTVYYALIGGDKKVVSPPMPFLATTSSTRILASETGSGVVGWFQPPTAANDSYSIQQDTDLTVPAPGVLGNDQGGELTAVLVSGPAHGTLNLSPNGSFTYSPNSGFVGTDSFTYKAKAMTVESNNATVTISVVPANHAPTDITLSNTNVTENQSIDTVVGALSATDPDLGDTHTFSLVAGAGDTDNASFTIVGSQLRTNAVFDYEAKKSYSVRIRATDQGGLYCDKVFTITVTPSAQQLKVYIPLVIR